MRPQSSCTEKTFTIEYITTECGCEWVREIISLFRLVVNWWQFPNELQMSSLRNANFDHSVFDVPFEHPHQARIEKPHFSLWVLRVCWKERASSIDSARRTWDEVKTSQIATEPTQKQKIAINPLEIEQTYVRSITNDVSHQLFVTKLNIFFALLSWLRTCNMWRLREKRLSRKKNVCCNREWISMFR